MVASGVGQFSINVKDNLNTFYGKLNKSYKTMKELTEKRNQLQIDSKQLDQLRDKGQRIAAEMRELRQQKTEIKLGMREVDNAEEEIKNLNRQIASLNSQKLQVEAEIQPIRTANAELYKVDQEIDRINSQKVSIDFGDAGDKLDGLSNKVFGLVKALGTIGAGGIAAVSGVLKEAVNEASNLEQNLGGVQKIFGDEASKKVTEDASKAYKEAGLSQNEYLEQATSFSASLISALEKGQTKTIDSSAQKEALKKQKADIEKALKENNYSSNKLNLNSEVKYEYKTDSKGKTTRKKVEDTDKNNQLKEYKKNALDLKKQKDKIDEQIANLPKTTTEQVGAMSKSDAQKSAADYVNKALVDMSDNANTFGTNIGEIQHAYEGIFKNNFTRIDNLKLGFKGSQEGAIEAVNTYGNLDEKITDISQVTGPMMIDTIHNAQEAMKISGTTAKEAATTYEGSLKMMKSAWSNFLANGTTSDLEIALPIYFDNLDKKLKELTPKLIAGLKKMVKVLPPKLKLVFEDLKKLLEESFDAVFGEGFSKNFEDGMKPFTNIISGIFKMINKSTKGEAPDLSALGSVIPNLLKLALGLKAVAVVFKGIKFAQDFGLKIPNFKGLKRLSSIGETAKSMKSIGVNDLKSLGMKMLTIAGIAVNIYLAAKALQEVQNIGDLGALQPKLLAIAEAVIGMGALVFAAGKLIDGKTAISGIAIIIGIAADIYAVAKALEEVDNINSDFGAVQAKIGQIALVVVEIGALAAIIGAVIDTGVGAAAISSGLLAMLAIAGTLYLTGQSVATISNLEIDGKKISNNIEIIEDTIIALGTLRLEESIFSAVGKLLSSLINLGIISSIVGIGNNISKIQKLNLDKEKATNAIKTIKEVVAEIAGGDKGGLFSKLDQLINGALDSNNLNQANSKFKAISAIGSTLEELQKKNLNKKNITDNLGVIKEAINSISNFATDDIVNNLGGMADALATITEQITKSYPPQYEKLGKLLATKMNESFKSTLNFKKPVSDRMSEIDKNTSFGQGSELATNMNRGFDSTLGIGEKIKKQINDALNNEKIKKQIQDIISKEYKATIVIDVDKDSKTKKSNRAAGGQVTAKYGEKLMDSPEKPTIENGEYIIPKRIVDALGVPFFDKLRNGQISRTFAGLGQKVSHTTSNIVNNIYNNTTNQNMNVYPGPRQDVMFIANRRIRV